MAGAATPIRRAPGRPGPEPTPADRLEARLEELRARLRAVRAFDAGRVRKLRRDGGLSVQELAELVGAGRSMVYGWENGRNVPKGQHASNLEAVLTAIEEETTAAEP